MNRFLLNLNSHVFRYLCRYSVVLNIATLLLLVHLLLKVYDDTTPVEQSNYYVIESPLQQNLNASLNVTSSSSSRRTVYIITPTYTRASQQPDLTRFAQTLMNVDDIHWIVVEDSPQPTPFVTSLLARLSFPHTHLTAEKSAAEAKAKTRGCSQRNAGLHWVLNNINDDGVLYFADDDNAYDVRLFDELRLTTRVGLVPVGHLGKTGLSSPVVKNGKVIDYLDVWPAGRKFPVEMASVSVNILYWRSRGSPLFEPKKAGQVETQFLEAMKLTFDDVEPLANNGTMFLVWHTRTAPIKLNERNPQNHRKKYKGTNIEILAKHIETGHRRA